MKTYAPILFLLASVLGGMPAQASEITRSSSFVYEANTGLLSREIIEPDNPNLCLVTVYSYDDYGNRKTVTTRNCNGSAGEAAAPSGDAVIASRVDKSTYTYNSDDTVTVEVENALLHKETRTYEPAFGNLVSLTGPNGLPPTQWQYDSFGRKHLEIRADGNTTQWDYAFYTGTSAQQPNIEYFVTTTVSGQASKSYDYFDQLGRKVLSQHRNFANTGWISTGNVVYNEYGQIEKSYLPYESGAFASAKYSTTAYDRLGRVKSQTTLTETDIWVTSTISYSGLTTVETDPLGHTKTTTKDKVGNTVSIKDSNSKLVRYTYDAFGNLLSTTDAAGNVIILSYDIRGRKISMDDPDMGIWTYAYNALGELIRQVDGRNKTVTITYDKLGRIKTRNEFDLTSNWTYDTAAYGIGKVASVSSGNGFSRTYTYDNFGRPESTSTIIDTATPYVVSVGYDSYGRVETQTYPTGFAIKNVYNANGYLLKVQNAATSADYWTANTMDAMGHLTKQTYSNVISVNQDYYAQTGRLQKQRAGTNDSIQNTSYNYDEVGNLNQRVDTVNSLAETFVYDALGRIKTATATSGAISTLNNYDYNVIGNLTGQYKKDVTTGAYLYRYSYTYNPSGANSVQPHAVASITTLNGNVYGTSNPVYTYDDNGNMLNGAGRTVAWNSFNMPDSVTGCYANSATCSTATFLYSAEHERIKEVQADKSVVIVLSPRYDTGLHFEKKYIAAANGTLTGAVEYEHTLYAGGIMFGQYVTTTATDGETVTSTKLKYYIKDHLGSVVATLNGSGAVTERMSYDIFGKPRYPDGAHDPNGLLNNKDMYHGYTGHEMMDALGLIHMNGRVYDPAIGRFLSADPTIQSPGNMQSYNRYTYGWNDPLNGTDPSGYSWLGERWYALTGTYWNDSRGYVATVAGIIGEAYGCGGFCSGLAGAYNGYQSGGNRGAVIGFIAAYVGYQLGADMGGGTAGGSAGGAAAGAGAEQVIAAMIINGAFGCASAHVSGGNCARGFATAAVGTLGAAIGNPAGTILAGCAAGRISGGSCGDGMVNAMMVFAIVSAAKYVAKSASSQNAAPTDKQEEPCDTWSCRTVAGDEVSGLGKFKSRMDENGCMVSGGLTICVGPGAIRGVGEKFLAYADAKFAARLAKQLDTDGVKSIYKTMKSLERNLEVHIQKLDSLEFKSSVEREINTFQKQIETVKQFIKDNSL